MATPNEINSNFRQIAVTDSNGDVYGVSMTDPSYLIVGGGVAGQVLSTDGSGTLSWINALPKTVTSTNNITATTTNPTKATNKYFDYITIVDDYSGWCDVELGYCHGNNAGVAVGSGTYLFELPGSYQFDTTVQSLNTQVTTLSNPSDTFKMVPATGYIQYATTVSHNVNYIVPHTATKFKIVVMSPVAFTFINSGYYQLDGIPVTYRINFRFKKA